MRIYIWRDLKFSTIFHQIIDKIISTNYDNRLFRKVIQKETSLRKLELVKVNCYLWPSKSMTCLLKSIDTLTIFKRDALWLK